MAVAERESMSAERRGDATDRTGSVTDVRGIQYLTNEYIRVGTEWAVSRQTQADGGVWQFNYVLNGLTVTQATVTDLRGNQTVHRFNGLGEEKGVRNRFEA